MASLSTLLPLALGLLLAAAEGAYLILALYAVLRYRHETAPPVGQCPAISVLVPAHGDFPGLYECLRSICAQDYPHFEVIFGLHSHGDTAKPVIERLMRDFPEHDIRLVASDRMIGANPKNCNLANIYPEAQYDIIAMVDSDIRVGPDFLATMAEELRDDDVGAVTCLYTAAAAPNLPSTFGALAINDWFVPSGLLDVVLREEHMCYGAAITMPRRALDELGGFEAMASAVAQDYVLGLRLRQRGYRIRLARYLVETVVAEPSFAKLFHHERRSNRAVRALRPMDHALSLVTHALPVTTLLLLLPGITLATLAVLGAVVSLRLALHHAVRARLPIGGGLQPLLVLLREGLSLFVWASTFTTRKMRWGNRVLVAVDQTSMIQAPTAQAPVTWGWRRAKSDASPIPATAPRRLT